MTKLDGQGLDSGGSPSDYATLEEVATELAALSASGLDRIEARARILVRGSTMEPRDLINTAVQRLLTRDEQGGRHWHRKETLPDCIYRTMKSIVRDYWRRQEIPMIAVSASAAGLREEPDPEMQTIARQELLAVLKTLGDDNNTSDIALALAGGYSPDEIRNKFGLTETDYESALKRIRRRILKHKASGGQP